MKDILAKPFPTVTEFIFLLAIIISVTLFVTFIDIMIHDSYVGPIISECYLENKSEFCEKRRADLLNQPYFWLTSPNDNPQLQLGGAYWLTLLTIPIFVGIILGFLRPVFGIMAGAKINPMLFIIGILWGLSVLSLYYFGWLDFLYYFLRDLPIPETLNWLDGVGAFQLVQNMGPTTSVDASDLYHLMGIGLALLIGVWSFMIHHHKKKTFHRLGLI